MIKLIDINKYYQSGQGKYHALKNINLTLPDKGMCFIVGKSGSGKSTLLNVIGGVDLYDSGELYIDNLNTKNFTKQDYNSYRNTYIGFIFQEFNVIKSLTVYDNIALSLELIQKNVKAEHEKIMEIINIVGLTGKEHRRMNEISGGERQRVAVARALVKDPEVIIADEPTGNLDSKNRDIVMDLLKKLSEDRLVIIVTHDKHLASKYADREIIIKDGEITKDTEYTNNCVYSYDKEIGINPIQPKLSVSLNLAWKSFLLHKIRFIFIIILFTISLTFAGIVINLYISNPSKEYADYQLEYGSITTNLSQNYTNSGMTNNSAFFLFELSQLEKTFDNVNEQNNDLSYYRYMRFNFPIDSHSQYEGDFYTDTVKNIVVYTEDNFIFENTSFSSYVNTCYITDYLAQALIAHEYLNCTTQEQLLGQRLNFTGFTPSLYIEKIIDTNYEDFEGADMSDSKVYGAFQDNLEYYSAIFMKKEKYEGILVPSNMSYFYDDVIFSSNGIKGFREGVKYTYYSYSQSILPGGRVPEKPKPGEQLQIAVSKGFVDACFNGVLPIGSTLSVTGVTRIPSSTSAIVTGIVNTDELVIYTPPTSQSELYSNLISSSFKEGGFLMLYTSNNPNITAEAYDLLMNNIVSNVSINNISYAKLKLVKDFISDNLFFFAGLFFVFCLFSILMIFNFVIINIKNSTRDIGIYMSLGMSGFKISMIYMFQVLIISLISALASLLLTGAFLLVLDSIFNAQTLIDFSIIKMTLLGILGILGIAFITPTVAIAAPLFDLSKKKPIDVIKES